jgi:hypothetical protein
MSGLASTPPTRIIPDEELPYSDNPSKPVAQIIPPYISNNLPTDSANVPLPTTLIAVPSPASMPSISIEELPADRIDSFASGGNFFSLFWEYLTLYWRN